MRYRVTFHATRPVSLPIEYQEYLTAAIYSFLARADPDYARFLHDEGYAAGDDSDRRFKLFTYSRLDAPKSRRRIEKAHDRIVYAPGAISWWISSPVTEFARHLASGMLAEGQIRVGTASLPIEEIRVCPAPRIFESTRFTCLSPIVASRPKPKEDGGGTHFIRPKDEPEAFSEAVRKNLIAKFQALHKREPEDTRFAMTFDAAYLARAREGGCKLTNFKGIQTVGAFAPFTATGSVELMEFGYEAGFGSKTGLGHGMAEVAG